MLWRVAFVVNLLVTFTKGQECYEFHPKDYEGDLDEAHSGSKCLAWNAKKKPVKIWGNTWQNWKIDAKVIKKRKIEHNYCRSYKFGPFAKNKKRAKGTKWRDENGKVWKWGQIKKQEQFIWKKNKEIQPWCWTKEDTWEYCDVTQCEELENETNIIIKEEGEEENSTSKLPTCGIRGQRKLGPSLRIVGGSNSKTNEFPWQAHLREIKRFDKKGIITRSTGYCGGSILNAEWILTAAHCIVDDHHTNFYTNDQIAIAVGFHDANDEEKTLTHYDKIKGTGLHRICKQIAHEKYDSDWVVHDIALIKLAEDDKINFPSDDSLTTNVRPACLPTIDRYNSLRKEVDRDLNPISELANKSENPTHHRKCVVSGWGDTEGDENVKQNLLVYANQPLIPLDQCRTFLQEKLGERQLNHKDDTQICGLHDGDGADSCGGDSGGPLVCNLEKFEPYTLLGVVSYGFASGCGRDLPGVYTNVLSYVDWIEKKTGANDLQFR